MFSAETVSPADSQQTEHLASYQLTVPRPIGGRLRRDMNGTPPNQVLRFLSLLCLFLVSLSALCDLWPQEVQSQPRISWVVGSTSCLCDITRCVSRLSLTVSDMLNIWSHLKDVYMLIIQWCTNSSSCYVFSDKLRHRFYSGLHQ